jgi:competence protein ComEC
MKRPLLMVALCYGGGVVLAEFTPVIPPAVPFLVGSAALALLALCWARARPVLTWVALFVAGAANLAFRQALLSPHDLREVIGAKPEIVSIRGRLSETPYQRVYEHGDQESWRTMAQVQVTDVRLRDGLWRPAFGRVIASTPGIVGGEFFGGRRVELEGVLREPRLPVAEGGFDYRRYLARQGIYYQLQVDSPNDWRIEPDAGSNPGRPVADRFGTWARAELARGLPVEDEPLRLLWAMTLGWKTALSGEVSEPFMRSGTMHVFAISGLHIALIAGLLVAVLRVFRIPRAWCGLIVIPLIWCYTGVTGWQASAIRSTLMMTVIIAGWSLRRPSDLLNSLAAAAFIILLWDPQQLFQASFQLSFLVVFSLALFTPALEKVRKRLLAHDPLLPEELLPRWRRWSRPPLDFVTTGMVVSLASWLGSLPLIAYYFHLFTPVSLLANLVVVPLSSAALACNLASLTVCAFLPGAAELFNHSAWFFMSLMVWLSESAARMPGGCLYVAAPPFVGFLFYYGLLVSVTAGWLVRPRPRWWAAGGLALLGTLWGVHWQVGRSNARLTIVPLSGGEAIYHRPAGRADDLLVDCGNESAVEFVLKPYLRSQGVNHLDRFLLTHGDIHHVGGARLLSELFASRKVLLSPVAFRSGAYREMLQHFERRPGRAMSVQRGSLIADWTVLHPAGADRFPQADDNTVVLRGELEGVRVLLLSDLGKPGQNALMERTTDLRADIVVAGVPTQTEPLADALLDVIQPKLIVITDSEFPATQRASRKVVERLNRRGVPVLYTRETGAVTFTLRRGQWEARTMSGVRTSGFGGGTSIQNPG